MPVTVVSTRQLAKRASDLVHEIDRTSEPVLVTFHGRPVAALLAVDELMTRQLDDLRRLIRELTDDASPAD